MPFISNGIDHKEVDENELKNNSEKYPGYVVCRRLFVYALNPNQTEVNELTYSIFNTQIL